MPLYRYQCNECGTVEQVTLTFQEHEDFRGMKRCHMNGPTIHDVCGTFDQVYDFHYNRSMPEHYSPQLGTYVTSDAHFQSELSRQADENSARMGFDVKYEQVDPTDSAAAGVTDA